MSELNPGEEKVKVLKFLAENLGTTQGGKECPFLCSGTVVDGKSFYGVRAVATPGGDGKVATICSFKNPNTGVCAGLGTNCQIDGIDYGAFKRQITASGKTSPIMSIATDSVLIGTPSFTRPFNDGTKSGFVSISPCV